MLALFEILLSLFKNEYLKFENIKEIKIEKVENMGNFQS